MYLFRVLFIILVVVAYSTKASSDVRITGLSDISFGSWSGSGDLQDDDDVCVYNSADGNYTVTATGDGAANAFTITKGSDTIAYTVEWKRTGGSYSELSTGTPSAFTNADTSSETCSAHSSDTANVQITMTEGDLSAAVPGSYSGTLTLVIDPN